MNTQLPGGNTEALTWQAIVDLLDLRPHPEGGFYREMYRAEEGIERAAMPERYSGKRCYGTAIYYLLTSNTFSTMHKVESDEIFHFYLGDTVEQLRLFDDGTSEIINLGQNIVAGDRPLSVVPHGVWQGARLKPGGAFALLGATVAPGFEFADYLEGERAPLTDRFPERAALISVLTRK